MLKVAADNCQLALLRHRVTNLGIPNPHVFHEVAELKLVLVGHLDDHAGVLGEERLDHVAVGAKVVQVDVQAAVGVCEAHLEQRGDKSSGRDVMAGHHPSAPYQLLHGVERIAEVVGVLHRGHVVAHPAQALCEGAAAEPLPVKGEVDVIKRRVLVVDEHGRHHLAHVADLASGRYDDRSGCYHLGAVGILLAHG